MTEWFLPSGIYFSNAFSSSSIVVVVVSQERGS